MESGSSRAGSMSSKERGWTDVHSNSDIAPVLVYHNLWR